MGLGTPNLHALDAHTDTHTQSYGSHGKCVPVSGIFQAASGTVDTPEFVLEVRFDLSG